MSERREENEGGAASDVGPEIVGKHRSAVPTAFLKRTFARRPSPLPLPPPPPHHLLLLAGLGIQAH